MAGPEEESPDVKPNGIKRALPDAEFLQRKKFKTEELPLSAAQQTAIEDLLHGFKKKGGFDNLRKKIWADFEEGVCYPLLCFPFSEWTAYWCAFSYRNTKQSLHGYWLNWQIRRLIENPNISRENGARQQP